jgi:hypothetical protein
LCGNPLRGHAEFERLARMQSGRIMQARVHQQARPGRLGRLGVHPASTSAARLCSTGISKPVVAS